MLPRMLLHVIGTANSIDTAVHRAAHQLAIDQMNHRSRILVFDAIDHCRVVDRSEVIRLTSRGRIERGLVQNDTDAVRHRPCFENRGVEFEKIRIVIIKPFGFHVRPSHQFTVWGA